MKLQKVEKDDKTEKSIIVISFNSFFFCGNFLTLLSGTDPDFYQAAFHV